MESLLLEKAMQHGMPPQGPVQVYAVSLWKCLTAPYLASSFDVEARIAAFLHTYSQLSQTITCAMMQELAGDDHLLWQSGAHLITAKMEHVITNEGEVTLHYRVGAEPLFGLSFGLVPGRLLSLGVPTVLYLARMQGRASVAHDANAPRDLSPQIALYAALLGIARALNIPVVGTSAVNQMCWTPERDAAFRRTYDDFYATMGGSPLGNSFFWLPVQPPRRSLSDIAIKHRRRTRQRREARDAIGRCAEEGWQALASGAFRRVNSQ
jgi:uncharacterized protein VirK/YbjX